MVDVGLVGKEEIGQPERHAVDDGYAARQVVTAQMELLFNIRPLWSATLLMPAYACLEFFVPDVGCGHIDGIVRLA